MATHSSILAWSIPGMEKPGGLPSVGSHRVRHNRNDLAAAAAAMSIHFICLKVSILTSFPIQGFQPRHFSSLCAHLIGYLPLLSWIIHQQLKTITYLMNSICLPLTISVSSLCPHYSLQYHDLSTFTRYLIIVIDRSFSLSIFISDIIKLYSFKYTLSYLS